MRGIYNLRSFFFRKKCARATLKMDLCLLCGARVDDGSACQRCRHTFRHVLRLRDAGVPDFVRACVRLGIAPRDGAKLVMTYLRRTCSSPSGLALYAARALIEDESFEHGFREILSRYRGREVYHVVTDEACAAAALRHIRKRLSITLLSIVARDCYETCRRRPAPSLAALCARQLSTLDLAEARACGVINL